MMAFFGASFAGLAAHLRLGRKITRLAILTAMLNSGFIGSIIALMGYQKFSDDPWN